MFSNMVFVIWMRSNIICKLLSFVVIALALGRCAHEGGSPKAEDPFKQVAKSPSVLLLFVSDLHSQLRANKDGQGGYAQLASWIQSEKAKAGSKTDVFVLGGGDLLGKGSIPCQKTNDKDCVPLMKDLQLDYATLGNYELYQSPADLKSLIEASGAKFLSSNVDVIREGRNAKYETPWERGPLKVEGKKSGLSFWLYSWTSPFDVLKNYNVRKFPSPSEWSAFKQTSAGAPVVFMTHMELENDLSFLRDACLQLSQAQQVVALLKSNDHKTMQKNVSQCAPVLEPGAFGNYALKVLLVPIAGQKSFQVHSEFVEIKGFPEDARVAAKIQKLYQAHAPDADEVIFTLNAPISKEALAQWVANSYRIVTHAEAAIVNVGYVKHGLEAGPVKKEDFLIALPYANELMGTDWSVKSLEKALCDVSRSKKDPNSDWGSELYFSGFSLENAGTPQCKITGTKRSSLKVVVDSYLVSRSGLWLGRDVSKQVFKFGVDSRRVGFLHVKKTPPSN